MGSFRAARLVGLSLLSCALGALSAVSAHAWVATIGDGGIVAIKLAQDGNVLAAAGLGAGSDSHKRVQTGNRGFGLDT